MHVRLTAFCGELCGGNDPSMRQGRFGQTLRVSEAVRRLKKPRFLVYPLSDRTRDTLFLLFLQLCSFCMGM